MMLGVARGRRGTGELLSKIADRLEEVTGKGRKEVLEAYLKSGRDVDATVDMLGVGEEPRESTAGSPERESFWEWQRGWHKDMERFQEFEKLAKEVDKSESTLVKMRGMVEQVRGRGVGRLPSKYAKVIRGTGWEKEELRRICEGLIQDWEELWVIGES